MQINSFRAFFELFFCLSIYVSAVKIANDYPVILLRCDRASSGSGQLFLDDCSLLFLFFKIISHLPKFVKLIKSPKFALFSALF